MSEKINWLSLRDAAREARFNMAFDEAMLISMPQLATPMLRFYGWSEPAASFGYFQKYEEVAALTLLRPLVRRTTGGGLVPHDSDWTYSIAFPEGHYWYNLKAEESYRRVHEWIVNALKSLGITATLAPRCRFAGPGLCFEGYEKHDVLWSGLKIAGAAQRRSKQGLLIQGSIQPRFPEAVRSEWELAMLTTAEKEFGIKWESVPEHPLVTDKATMLLQQKYRMDSYHQKR